MSKRVIRLTFKDPDCFVDIPGKEEINSYYDIPGNWRKELERFVEWGEYVTIEYYPDDGRMEVMEV